MEKASPTYHPSFAKNYINVTNNLNPNDTYIWYDSQNPGNIMFPSTFNYKKTSSWNSNLNLRLNSVTLNSASGSISNVNPALPSAEGAFNATLQLQNGGAPTMDLYFTGNIQKNSMQIYPRYDYDVPSPSTVYISSPHYEFYSNTGTFPISKVKLTWGRGSGSVSFSPSSFYSETTGSRYTYRYTGDKISFTTNWNSEYHDSNIVSPSSSIEFNGPNTNVTAIPTVYCSWEVLWDYPCSCNTDCNSYCGSHCSTHGGGGYIEWPGTYNPSYVIRTSPGGSQAFFTLTNYNVTVTGESGDWYYCAFNTTTGIQYGWVISDGISGDNPNSGGGCTSDGCNDDSCSSYCSHMCSHSCSMYDCEGYVYCSQY